MELFQIIQSGYKSLLTMLSLYVTGIFTYTFLNVSFYFTPSIFTLNNLNFLIMFGFVWFTFYVILPIPIALLVELICTKLSEKYFKTNTTWIKNKMEWLLARTANNDKINADYGVNAISSGILILQVAVLENTLLWYAISGIVIFLVLPCLFIVLNLFLPNSKKE